MTCCSEERGDAEKFVIQYHVDGSGRWAICNQMTSYYLGGTDDKLSCYEKQPGPSEWWTVHLAVHPQVRYPLLIEPRAGPPGVVRIDPLRFLAGCQYQCK